MPHDKRIALSYSGKLYLLLKDVDLNEHKILTLDARVRRSTWLNLETGEVKGIDLCQRTLFNVGWSWFV